MTECALDLNPEHSYECEPKQLADWHGVCTSAEAQLWGLGLRDHHNYGVRGVASTERSGLFEAVSSTHQLVQAGVRR